MLFILEKLIHSATNWVVPMTHVSMIGLHDYKGSKWSRVLSACACGSGRKAEMEHSLTVSRQLLGKVIGFKKTSSRNRNLCSGLDT